MNGDAGAQEVRGVVDVACDESGFVGGSLFGATRVFAHASLDLDIGTATDLAHEVRRRLGVEVAELKASRLNRPWAHPVSAWLCAPDGPLAGHVVVHVTDTRVFGLARLAQVLLADTTPEGWWGAREDPRSWDRAVRLSAALGRLPQTRERELLLAARDLLWIRRRRRHSAAIETWAGTVGAVADRMPDAGDLRFLAGWASEEALRRAQEYVESPPAAPLSEPLLPALRWAVHHWSARGDLDVVHDEQSVLTPARVSAIADELEASCPGRRIVRFTRVDSRDDARVQIADLVAGLVRRVLEDHLSGAAGDVALPLSHLVAEESPVLPTTWGAPFFGEVSANAMPPSTAS